MSTQKTLSTDEAIRERKTVKVLATRALPLPDESFEEKLSELISLAGMAPFHRACADVHRAGSLTGIEPWRMHVLTAGQCRKLVPHLPGERAGKLPAMLSAADAMILVTWLPNPPSDAFPLTEACAFEPTHANMEHIAAASSAVQNLLLAATTRGIANYWSSGGDLLRSREVLQMLGIPATEILLAAVFLFPSETSEAQVVGSKLREHRTLAGQWSRRVVVPDVVPSE